MNEFIKRTLSATVYAAVVVSSILVNRYYFGAVFLIVTLLAVREYMHLMSAQRRQTVGAMVAAALLFATGFFLSLASAEVNAHPGSDEGLAGVYGVIGGVLFLVWLVLMIVLLVSEVFRHTDKPIHDWGTLLQSQWMIAFPFMLTNFLLLFSPYCLLMVFIAIWVNDTGAYIVGCTTAKLMPNGNHKMAPHISPAKSWEGLAGGYVFTLLCAAVFVWVGWMGRAYADYVEPVMWWHAVLFAVVVSTTATLGDLMESLMKRSLGVKDSGCFMPGHGGVLDRFDSLLLTVPVWFIVSLIVSLLSEL